MAARDPDPKPLGLPVRDTRQTPDLLEDEAVEALEGHAKATWAVGNDYVDFGELLEGKNQRVDVKPPRLQPR